MTCCIRQNINWVLWQLLPGEFTSMISGQKIGEKISFLPHTNPADTHCRKHLILLGCLSQKCEDIKFQRLHIRTMVRITKLKEKLQGHGRLRKMGYFIVCFKFWWNKTSSVDFQVYLVNLKKDTVTGLKFDIEIGRTDYSTSLSSIFLSIYDLTLTARRDGLV